MDAGLDGWKCLCCNETFEVEPLFRDHKITDIFLETLQ